VCHGTRALRDGERTLTEPGVPHPSKNAEMSGTPDRYATGLVYPFIAP